MLRKERELPVSPSTARRAIPWLAALGFALRVGARLYSGGADFWVNGYTFFFAMAQNIAAGHGVGFDGGPPTAFRVPLYPMFLAAITFGHQAFIPVLLAQALIGAGTVLCAALLGAELFDTRAAVTAGALTAVYPYYMVHDTALQETGLFTFLTALAILLLVRAHRNGRMRRPRAGCGDPDAGDRCAVRGAGSAMAVS